MLWFIPAAGLAAVGAARGVAQKKAAKSRELNDRLLNAEITRYSPWTGMAPQPVQPAQYDVLGTALQGGLQGAAFGQKVNELGAAKQFQDDYLQMERDRINALRANAFNQNVGPAMQMPAMNYQYNPWVRA